MQAISHRYISLNTCPLLVVFHCEVTEYLGCGKYLAEVSHENQALDVMTTSSSGLCSQNTSTPPQCDLSTWDQGAPVIMLPHQSM